MTVLTTRSAKGSELSHSELDANFKRTVAQKTTTYACLVSDNRSVIECLHASTPFTVTLGDAATMVAADTGDYEATIVNIGAAVVTVARAGSDTIDGSATSITLSRYESVTLKVISAGTGYSTVSRNHDIASSGANSDITALSGITSATEVANFNAEATGGLRVKIIDIGDWDMDATGGVGIAHGLTQANIRSIQVVVRDDGGSLLYPLDYDLGAGASGRYLIASTNVNLTRATSGAFDSTNYNSTSYNRGWITIWHTQ